MEDLGNKPRKDWAYTPPHRPESGSWGGSWARGLRKGHTQLWAPPQALGPPGIVMGRSWLRRRADPAPRSKQQLLH